MAAVPTSLLTPDIAGYLLTGAGFVINSLIGVIVYTVKKNNDAAEKRLQELERITQNEMVRVGTFVPFRTEFLESFRRMEDRIGARLDAVEGDTADLQKDVGRLQGRLDAQSK